MNAQFVNLLNLLRKELGESIVEQRRGKRLKQWELALMCGVSERMLRLIEGGEQRFSLDTYLLIATALDLPMEALLAESIARIEEMPEGKERLHKERQAARQCMQRRLERNWQNKLEGGKDKQRSQDAETKAKYQPKGLARGGKCARIFVSMILNLFAFRNFALQKAAQT